MTKKETASKTLNTKASVTKAPSKTTTKTTAKKTAASVEEQAKKMAEEMAQDMAKDIAINLAKEMFAEFKAAQPVAKPEKEYVSVRSLTEGGVSYRTSTGMLLSWAERGNTQLLDVKEIHFMRNNHPRFLTEGYLFVEDAELSQELRLGDIYNKFHSAPTLEALLEEKLEVLEEGLEAMLPSTLQSIASVAAIQIQKNKLVDLNKIRLLQEKTGVDLDLYIQK